MTRTQPLTPTLPTLPTMSTTQLSELMLDVATELAERTDHNGAELLPAMAALGRSMGLVGRSVGMGYAGAWQHTAAPARRPPACRRNAPPGTPEREATQERLFPMTMYGIREDVPGPQWASLFRTTWVAYRAWFTSEGIDQRSDLATCQEALERHMPELVSTWRRLVDLTGGNPLAARMLSLWNPPAFAPGCSQLVLDGPQRLLVRNYDYDPTLFEQVVYSSRFGIRRVIGTGDCLWGLLDGMNDDGLVVSLTYGGRPGTGSGFAIPLVVRYLLETCVTVADARTVLERLPVAAAYNLTISDASSAPVTVFVAPDCAPEVFDTPLATNHRGIVPEYPEQAKRLRSVERQKTLQRLLESDADAKHVAAEFLQAPLRNTAFSRGFGTLYTAIYRPDRGCVEYVWPEASWRRAFDSPTSSLEVVLREPLPA